MDLSKEELGMLANALDESRVAARGYEEQQAEAGIMSSVRYWQERQLALSKLRGRVIIERDAQKRGVSEELVKPADKETGTPPNLNSVYRSLSARYPRADSIRLTVRWDGSVMARINEPNTPEKWLEFPAKPNTRVNVTIPTEVIREAVAGLKDQIIEAIREAGARPQDSERSSAPVLSGEDWDRVMVGLEERQNDLRERGARTVAARYHETGNKIREWRTS